MRYAKPELVEPDEEGDQILEAAFREWVKTLPVGVPIDPKEAYSAGWADGNGYALQGVDDA